MPASGPPKFQYYEQVRIVTNKPDYREVTGEVGVILGLGLESDPISYGVYVLRTRETWCCVDTDLESTGVVYQREDFYSGESFRVRVDEFGRGHIVP